MTDDERFAMFVQAVWPQNQNAVSRGVTVVMGSDGFILTTLWWAETYDGSFAVDCFEFPEITTAKSLDELEALAELISMRGKPQQ